MSPVESSSCILRMFRVWRPALRLAIHGTSDLLFVDYYMTNVAAIKVDYLKDITSGDKDVSSGDVVEVTFPPNVTECYIQVTLRYFDGIL